MHASCMGVVQTGRIKHVWNFRSLERRIVIGRTSFLGPTDTVKDVREVCELFINREAAIVIVVKTFVRLTKSDILEYLGGYGTIPV